MAGVGIISLRENHKIKIEPVVIDEVIKVNLYPIAQMNVSGITRVVPNQAVVHLNDIVDTIVEHGPVIGAG